MNGFAVEVCATLRPQRSAIRFGLKGYSMLATVANDLAASGHESSIAVDSRLVSEQQLAKLRAGCRIVRSSRQLEQLPDAWWEVARSTDEHS